MSDAQIVLELHREIASYEKRISFLEMNNEVTNKRLEAMEAFVKQQGINAEQQAREDTRIKLQRLEVLEKERAELVE